MKERKKKKIKPWYWFYELLKKSDNQNDTKSTK